MKNALKRSLSVLLAITIIFSSAYVGLGEVDFSKVNFNGLFAVKANAASSGTCGDNLTWTLNDNGKLTISGTGNMTNFSPILLPPWMYSNVTTIIIDSGVTSIGQCAFAELYYLTSITIPDSVTSIGSDAFYGCGRLNDVYYTGTKSDWAAVSITRYGNDILNNVILHCAEPQFFEYIVNNNEIKITGYTGTDTVVIIPKKKLMVYLLHV